MFSLSMKSYYKITQEEHFGAYTSINTIKSQKSYIA